MEWLLNEMRQTSGGETWGEEYQGSNFDMGKLEMDTKASK